MSNFISSDLLLKLMSKTIQENLDAMAAGQDIDALDPEDNRRLVFTSYFHVPDMETIVLEVAVRLREYRFMLKETAALIGSDVVDLPLDMQMIPIELFAIGKIKPSGKPHILSWVKMVGDYGRQEEMELSILVAEEAAIIE